MKKLYFEYGAKEITHLKAKDKRLAEVIDKIGLIKREMHTDVFEALVSSIVSQQISGKAATTVINRMHDALGAITAERIASRSIEALQQFGMTFSKARYIQNAGLRVTSGDLDLSTLHQERDSEICKKLCAFDGIGVWTAEMLMIFSLGRKDVLSFGDLGIHKGMRMVYHHRKISRELFEKYRRRFSPYGTIAGFYFWAVAGGAIEGMRDFAPKQ